MLDLGHIRQHFCPRIHRHTDRLTFFGMAAYRHAYTRISQNIRQFLAVLGGDEIKIQPVIHITQRRCVGATIGTIDGQCHQVLAIQ